MTSILVQGWRGISHSYALVNQFQLLEMAKRPDVTLCHEDLPYYHEHWNRQRCGDGLPSALHKAIASIPQWHGEEADIVYRINYPYLFSPTRRGRLFVFGTAEHQFLRDDMIDQASGAMGDVTIITPSHWSREGFIRYGFPENWVRVVPHGVSTEIFYPPSPQERARARSGIGFQDGHFVFLNIGALTANKGLDILVRAFAIIRQRHVGAVLLLKDARALYEFTAEAMVKDIIQRHNIDPAVADAIAVISDNLTMADMRQVYGLADAYVSPYRAEGFNLPPLEAAACGLPILVTSGGATDDYVHPSFAIPIAAKLSGQGPENWLEPDLDSVVAGMETLITRRATSDPKAAAVHIAKNFSWAAVTQKLLGAFGL